MILEKCKNEANHKRTSKLYCLPHNQNKEAAAKKIICIPIRCKKSDNAIDALENIAYYNNIDVELVCLSNTRRVNQNPLFEKTMIEILNYLTKSNITTWAKSIDTGKIENYIAEASKTGIVVALPGKENFLSAFFSRRLLKKIVNSSRSDVFVLG